MIDIEAFFAAAVAAVATAIGITVVSPNVFAGTTAGYSAPFEPGMAAPEPMRVSADGRR
jgi:hypothetical protein